MSWLSVGTSLLGGLLSADSSERAGDDQMNMFRQNMAMQREFAQNGIRWRVEDAKAAGVHPIFAMGANLPAANPVSVFPTSADHSYMGEVGSHLSRAIDATRTPEERQETRLEALTIRRAELENDLLEAQIIGERQRQMQPAFPSGRLPVTVRGLEEANGDLQKAGLVSVKPLEVTASHPQNSTQEPGTLNDLGFVRTPTGLAPVPSKDVKERIEDQMIPEAMWALRNHLIPSLGDAGSAPPKSFLPEGAYSWEYNVAKQEWQPVFRRPQSKPGYDDFWPKDRPWSSWSGRPYLGRSRVGSYY